MSLYCLLFGHDALWDRTNAGAPCFRCSRCDWVKPRYVDDVRPVIVNTDPRFRMEKS